MARSDDIRFRGIAARFRKVLRAEKEAEAANEEKLDKSIQLLEPVEESNDEHSDSSEQLSSKTEFDYLFDESGIRVSLSAIEFGKFTYILKYLASTKRTDKVPARTNYQMIVVLTFIAVLMTIIYIFTGRVTFGLGAVAYLLASLFAFVVSVVYYLQLKSIHILVFKDASGDTIQTVRRHDKAVIDRLEKAVKLAVSRNSTPQN